MNRRQFLETGIGTGAAVATGRLASMVSAQTAAGSLRGGVAKVDITHPEAATPGDPLYAKVLVLSDAQSSVVLVTLDVVAIAEIGPIRNDYLAGVRRQLQQELGIEPAHVLVNASHCHGNVCADVQQRTVQAVKEAWQNRVPVIAGAGSGREERIMENRRLRLNDGGEADIRHAYSDPPDEKVAAVGPVDPEIGILRLDRSDGQTLAVVYNFACHPIQGIPSGGNTADIVGFASKVIESNLSDGTVALFLQGCAGDVNPIRYKDVDSPRDAEPLGNMLGLNALKAMRKVSCRAAAPLRIVSETIDLPRADHAPRIAALEAEQKRLLQSLKGTSLNFKTFVPLYVRHHVSSDFPSFDSHAYLHDRMIGRDDWSKLDALNREKLKQYVQNIRVMEELTRVQENLNLLRKHQSQNLAAGKKTLDAEVVGLRVGDCFLVTFPGELSVQIGLNIKKSSPHPRTFVAGYTNGYIYYTPTEEQLANPGQAQEDCDCLVGKGWQKVFESKAVEVLKKL